MPRPSLFNLGVQVSPHPAFDVLSFRFCSCGGTGGSFGGRLLNCPSSSCCDFHLYDADVLSRHSASLSHSVRMYGFAVLGF